ncbi:MAG: HPr family phosphocarrier protein [Fusobacteriaceae bacterium]|jgi:phosphocarrier protein HPr|nr:HPr family phosphocarrier protein [Fusobacteriaceae bacterium]MBN2837755.1 HPr family phosphocarrier protein [Fusobacteriaceae bacterium]
MATKTVVITNDTGIHTRPGNEFVGEAKKFESTVTLKANGKEINGKSLLKLLSLGAKKGTEVTVITEGPDADAACKKLADVLANLKD